MECPTVRDRPGYGGCGTAYIKQASALWQHYRDFRLEGHLAAAEVSAAVWPLPCTSLPVPGHGQLAEDIWNTPELSLRHLRQPAEPLLIISPETFLRGEMAAVC